MKKVITFGVFDYFHYGHLRLFERAKKLGDYLELKLGVCFMYKPAVNLYKRKGFKIYAYRTHTPYTYCHYGMVKRLKNGGIFFELKRMVCRLFQKIKHFLLFKKDGTPKLLYKIFSKNK